MAAVVPQAPIVPAVTPVNVGGAVPTAPTAVAAAAGVGITPSYPMASLYVGDLHPDVTEAMLFDKFSTAGPVLSIRVCRDAISRRSLGYAYVNFQQPADAERALDTMNFDILMNKPIRIMWSQRDPSVRRSGAGNIFIKNLDKRIDTKAIYDTFSMFGSILSCKVAIDSDGESKGYGFIHFETEDSAQKAIDKVDGMLLDGKKVFVGKFQPRAARMREFGETSTTFTNVYVKNFDDKLDKAKLESLFSQFGEILSCAVMTDSEGKSKGFGFISFKKPEDAANAVAELNGYKLEDGSELTVCRAQKKSDRHAELKRKFEQLKAERMQRYQGVNLYVKNLDDNIDDKTLQQNFESYGKITSAKVMCDENGRSKGFGFVCFEKPDDATKAVVDMNNKMLSTKPLYVALAQRKEDRKAQLASQYMQRLAALRMQNPAAMPGTMYNPNGGGFFVPSTLPNQRAFMQAPTAAAAAINASAQMRGGAQRWGNYGAAAFNPMQANYIMPNNQYNQSRGPRSSIQGGMRSAQYGGASQANRAQNRIPNAMMQGQSGMRQPHMQMNQNRQPMQHQHQYSQQQQQPQSGISVTNQETLTTQMLAAAQPQEQKQMLGERLFPLIQRHCKDADAGKVTGMMLEMENSEILMMLENEELLRAKVNEALQVLHASKPGTA